MHHDSQSFLFLILNLMTLIIAYKSKANIIFIRLIKNILDLHGPKQNG